MKAKMKKTEKIQKITTPTNKQQNNTMKNKQINLNKYHINTVNIT